MNSFTIPGYEILEKIGEGGMGSVYRARQESLGRIVAVKVLRADLAKDPSALAQFRLEANSVANLKHPNILMLHEAGEQAGTHYFVMEYVSAYSVQEWLDRKGRLSETDAITIADAVAQALHYAWEKGELVHCDLKPGNLLVDEDGMVKVADFSGISRNQDTVEARLVNEMTIGTPNYMAPEQAHGIEDVDARADIYALGAVLYQLVTGRLPFDHLSPEEAMQRQISAHLPDPRSIQPDVSESLTGLIERMMVKDRTRRYKGWQDVLDDLSCVRAGHSPSTPAPLPGSSTLRRMASPPQKPEPRKKRKQLVVKAAKPAPQKPEPRDPDRKHRIGLLVAIALALLLVNVFLIGSLLRTSDRRAPGPPPAEPESIHAEPETLHAAEPQEDRTAPTWEPWNIATPYPDARDSGTDVLDPSAPLAPEAWRSPLAARPSRTHHTPPAPVIPDPTPDTPKEEEYTAMLNVHRSALGHAREGRFSAAHQVFLEWLRDNPDHPFFEDVHRSAERLQSARALIQSMETDPDALLGIEVASVPGGGTVAGLRRGVVRIRRILGPGGIADIDIELYRLDSDDILALMEAYDPDNAWENATQLTLAQGRLSAAESFLNQAEFRDAEADYLLDWHEQWREIHRDLAALRAIREAEQLLKLNGFAEARTTILGILEHYGDTRVVYEFRAEELRSWLNLATEGALW